MSVDEVGGFRSKEDNRSPQVFRCSPPSGRCSSYDECVEGMSFRPQRSGLRCCYIARAYAVNLDIELSPFTGQVFCQHLEPTFGRGVGRDRLTSQFAHHRTYIDDLASAFLNHTGSDRLRHDEWSREIDVNDLAVFLHIHLQGGYPFDDPGIIDQDVYDLS